MTERHNRLQTGNQFYHQDGLDDGMWAFDATNAASLDASSFSLNNRTSVISPGATGPSQVVFIDSRTPDIADLINGALPGEQIFVLDPTQDGLDQIASILKANDLSGLSAISIVGHGASGEIDLGSAVIDDANLANDAAALSAIGASLAPGGDLALYACDTAAGATGHQFIADLSTYAGGVDVAAATHLVGSADLGGSWTLDASTAPAATATAPFTAAALADYTGVLGTQPGRIFLTTSNTEVISIDVNGSAGATNATTLASAATTSNFHLSLYGIASDTATGKYFVVDEAALSGSSSTILAGNISGGGGAVTPIYTSAVGAGIYGMRFDAQNSKLYFAQVDPGWPSVTTATGIYTINEDGTGLSKLVSFTGADSATAIAIDTADNLLFFTDGGFAGNPVESVGVANLTTGAIISTNLFSIDPSTTSQLVGGIDVDPANHKIYWTTSDAQVSANNEVFSATFSIGASVTLSPITSIYTGSTTAAPYDVAIDAAAGIFYTAISGSGTFKLVEGNLNGTGTPTTVYTSSGFDPVFESLELAPTLTLSGAAPTALKGGPAVPLDSAVTVVDSAQDIASATVSITGGLASGDALSFENGASHFTFGDGHTINASFTSGTLSLTGDATAADYQSALDTVAFSTTSTSGADRTVSWSVSDGNLSSATSPSTVHILGPPAVTSESHTPSSGSHIDAGKTVTFSVTFSAPVTVTTGSSGAPTLQLNDSEVATYSSGSGTNTLTFSYTVQPGDTVSDLKATSFVALPTGTTIKDGSGQNADLSGFTAIDSGVQVDTTAPSVTSVGVPANATYIAGQDLDFTVHLSEAVTVTGTPEIALTLDTGGTVDAQYVSGSGTSALVFSYAVIGGEADTNGIGVGNAIILNGGTVQDAATNAAVLTLNNVGLTGGVLVDSIPPTVSSVSVPTDGVYSIGQTLAFTVNFSENVLVTTGGGGAPYIDVTLDTGGTVHAVYTGGSGTSALTFAYTVASGNDDANGIAVGSSINLNGGTINDAATNAAVLTLSSIGSTTGVLVHAIPPTVSSIDTADNSTNNLGTEHFTVTFSEAVTGVDASDFTLVGTGTVNGAITSVSGSGTTWTVTVGNVVGDGALRLDLNNTGDAITDTYGNTLTTAHTGDQSYTIEHTAPAAPTLALTHDTGVSNSDNITSDPSITYSAPASGDTLLYKVDGGSFSATVPVFATDGSADGLHTVSVEEEDAAGNISAAASLSFTLDTTAPATPTLVLTHDTGASNTDGVTSDPSITYSTPAPGDTLLYKVDGGGYSATVPVFATDHSADGMHTVSVEEVDSAGNVSNVASLSFTLDTTTPGAPTLALTHDTGGSNSDNITSDPSITYSTPLAGDTLLYKVDGGSYSATVPVFATDHSADGLHTVSVEEVDAAGNVSSAASLSFTLDTIAPAAPTLALTQDTGVSNTDHLTSDPSITYALSAAGDTLLYKVDGGSYSATAPVFATNGSADGLHTVSVEEVDAAGNVSTAANLSFTLDTADPTVSVTADHTALLAGQTALMTFTFSEAVSGFGLGDTTVSGGSLSNLVQDSHNPDVYTATFTPNANNTEAGSVQVNASSYTDIAGNNGTASNTVDLTGDTLAPTAVATALPSSGTEVIGDLVQITLTFGEAVTIAGSTPALALNDGGTATFDAAATAALHDASKLVFDYTVASSDANTSPLAITGVAHGTTITDLAGNAAGVAATLTGLGVLTSLVTANPDTNHVVANQTVTADAAHGVLANDPDTNPADHVVVSAVDGLAADVGQPIAGAYGTLTLHADGSYVYAADNAATGEGTDTFTYTASNGHGPDSTSTLTITVSGANQSYVQVPSGGSATGGYNNTILDGSAGGATLTAAETFNAHQILVGGPGDTLNAASFGQDTFVFADNFGHETINNFHPALDVIQLQQSQFGSLAAVMADIQQVGADSVLTLDANHVITITNTPHTSLTASDFHLV
jgi:VCBS repeat-containing protein